MWASFVKFKTRIRLEFNLKGGPHEHLSEELILRRTPKNANKGQHNPTPISERRHARRTKHTNYRLEFTDRDFTMVAGYPMLDNLYDQFDLRQRFQRRLRHDRHPNIAHTESELFNWLVDQNMLGAKRLSHAERFRNDPILCNHYGVDGLASDSTVSRYLRGYDPQKVRKIKRVSRQVTLEGLARLMLDQKLLSGNENRTPAETDPEP